MPDIFDSADSQVTWKLFLFSLLFYQFYIVYIGTDYICEAHRLASAWDSTLQVHLNSAEVEEEL